MAELLRLLTSTSVERCAPRRAMTLEEALAAIGPGRRANCSRSGIARRLRICGLKSTAAREKLGNEAFVAKAAPSVVAKEREKLAAYRAELARVEAALAS